MTFEAKSSLGWFQGLRQSLEEGNDEKETFTKQLPALA